MKVSMSPVAVADGEECGSVAGNLVSRGKADASTKESLHTESHARMLGLCLGALLAACLVLNAASPSTRLCQRSDRESASTGTYFISDSTLVAFAPADGLHLHLEIVGTIRSGTCAANRSGEEPGY